MTRAILFDLYGTLVEPDWVMLRAGRDAIADRLGVPRAAAHAAWAATHAARMRGEYASLEGDLAAVRAAAGARDSADGLLLSELAAVERANWRGAVQLHDDVGPMLRRLRHAGARLAIVTNASAEAAGVIPALGLDVLVDVVVASCTARVLKPDLLRVALGNLGVSAVEALLIDDEPQQVAAAKRMGMSAVLVHPGAGSTAMPDGHGGAVVTNLTRFADLLLSAETAPLR
jgi:HAD superfamily hydrolase (TIGR01509 family)